MKTMRIRYEDVKTEARVAAVRAAIDEMEGVQAHDVSRTGALVECPDALTVEELSKAIEGTGARIAMHQLRRRASDLEAR